MRLTKFSDYSLRVLLFAASHTDRLVTIEEVSEVFTISRAHLKKVVRQLTGAGYLEGLRGRNGGFRLAKAPRDINIGQVIRFTETDFETFECFGENGTCRIVPVCQLAHVGHDATQAFLAVFDRYSLADIAVQSDAFTADQIPGHSTFRP